MVKLLKLHRLTFLTGLLLGAVLFLAACGGVAQESAEQSVARQQEVAEESTDASAPADTPEPDTPTSEPATATSQPAEEPAEEEVAETEPTSPPAKPTPRQGFAATPPKEVQLASGQVQLVEFYATW